MRKIDIYEVQMPGVTGSIVDLDALGQKLPQDQLLLQQIEQDYNRNPSKHKDEYLSAKRNYLKNRFTYSWLFLIDCFGRALLSFLPSAGNGQKEGLKKQGWMLHPELINRNLNLYPDDNVEDQYVKLFDNHFDHFFNFTLTEDNLYLDAYYKQAIFCYKNNCYYPCAVALFPIIEFYHKRLTDFDEGAFYKIKNNLGKVNDKVDGVHQVFQAKITYFSDLVNQFNDLAQNCYFNSSFGTNDEPTIINRNRIMHGIFTREISQKDCLQLFCVISNMVFIKAIIDENDTMNKTLEELNNLDQPKE